MTTVSIRSCHDLDHALSSIDRAGWAHEPGLGAFARWYRDWKGHPPRRIWLAHRQDRLIGLATISEPVEGSRGRAVLSVFVAPQWRRRGLGRALSQRALRVCPALAASAHEPPTQLYSRLGVMVFEPAPPPANQAEARRRFVRARLASDAIHRRRSP